MSAEATDGDRKGPRRNGKIKVFLRRSIDDARQLMYPSPFRIKESPDLVTVSKDMLLGNTVVPAARVTGQKMDADFRRLLQTIAAVATALWRVREKLEAESKVELPPELRHLPRHVEAAWDALASGGFEVQDPRGQRYVPGMAVNPITFQPVEGVGTEIIHETIKPSVFYKDVLIQRADVIVGRPVDDKGAATPSGLASNHVSTDGETGRSMMPGAVTPGDPDQQQANSKQ